MLHRCWIPILVLAAVSLPAFAHPGHGNELSGLGAGLSLPSVELGIAASVVILGILIVGAKRLPLSASVCLVGLFAVFHGHAHGNELTGAATAFGLGFVAATTSLHAAGIALGRLLMGPQRLMLTRGVGGAVAAIGLMLLGGWI